MYQATLTKQMGTLSITLPIERLKRGKKKAKMDLSLQKFDPILQSYTISMTMTLLFFSVLMNCAGGRLFIVVPLILRFIVHKISQIFSLSNPMVIVQ